MHKIRERTVLPEPLRKACLRWQYSEWIEPRPAKAQGDLLQKMLAVRKQGTKLSKYYRERQAA